jgi:hypothetical protein
MPKLMTISILIVIATALCGFSSFEAEYSLSAYRGEPVRAAIARLGPPIQTAYAEGQRIYYWRAILDRDVCKIWGAARHGIIVTWGYQSCAF